MNAYDCCVQVSLGETCTCVTYGLVIKMPYVLYQGDYVSAHVCQIDPQSFFRTFSTLRDCVFSTFLLI